MRSNRARELLVATTTFRACELHRLHRIVLRQGQGVNCAPQIERPYATLPAPELASFATTIQ